MGLLVRRASIHYCFIGDVTRKTGLLCQRKQRFAAVSYDSSVLQNVVPELNLQGPLPPGPIVLNDLQPGASYEVTLTIETLLAKEESLDFNVTLGDFLRQLYPRTFLLRARGAFFTLSLDVMSQGSILE